MSLNDTIARRLSFFLMEIAGLPRRGLPPKRKLQDQPLNLVDEIYLDGEVRLRLNSFNQSHSPVGFGDIMVDSNLSKDDISISSTIAGLANTISSKAKLASINDYVRIQESAVSGTIHKYLFQFSGVLSDDFGAPARAFIIEPRTPDDAARYLYDCYKYALMSRVTVNDLDGTVSDLRERLLRRMYI